MILEEIYLIVFKTSSFKAIKQKIIVSYEPLSIFDFSKYMRESEHSITYTDPRHISELLTLVYKVSEHLKKLFLKFYVDRLNNTQKVLFSSLQGKLSSIEAINLDNHVTASTEHLIAESLSNSPSPLIDFEDSKIISINPGKGPYLNIDIDLDITVENFKKDIMNGFYVLVRGEPLEKEFFIAKKTIAILLILDAAYPSKEDYEKKKMKEFFDFSVDRLLIFSPYYNNHYIQDDFPLPGTRVDSSIEDFFKLQTILSLDKSQSPFSVTFMEKIKKMSKITDDEEKKLSEVYLKRMMNE